MQHVLITGASGLIGSKLTEQLLAQGYKVSHLSRGKGHNPNIHTYLWDVDNNIIDENCLNGVDAIIHLAGASVAARWWTSKNKQEIIDSRVKSIGLIYNLMRNRHHQVKHVISASAVGYYGNRGSEILKEDSEPGNDFLADCCLLWEQAVDDGIHQGVRVVKLRTGIVLSKKGGALPAIALPVKFGAGAALGTGSQWSPWIHVDDAADMYIYALKNVNVHGAYNMAAPNPVTNKDLTKAIAAQLHKPFWLPNVPAFMLKLILGERSIIVLESTRVSPDKIQREGFTFKYEQLDAALADIYG